MTKEMNSRDFKRFVKSLDGSGYGKYKALTGTKVYFKDFRMEVTHVQGDPHAPPSFVEVIIPWRTHKLPSDVLTPEAATPLTDYLGRRLYFILKRRSRKCGLGNSCYMGIPKPSHHILRRSSAEVIRNDLLIRFFIGLPAQGRRVLGREAARLLTDDVEESVKELLSALSEVEKIRRHVKNYLIQENIREWLRLNGYVAFLMDGSVLPRKASFSEEPLTNAVPLKSPPTLQIEICVQGKCFRGMGLKNSITVITGGAYHGKTTLLEAIQEGIYDHVEGDGREFVVSLKDTTLVRAEDGRVVTKVDISPFMGRLPDGTDTASYSTLDASGSSSMASAISEAIEAGVTHLLLDEDISATNLLYKDEYMSELLKDDPVKPLNTTIRNIKDSFNVSFTAVVSASSELPKKADTVILMRRYIPFDITAKFLKADQKERDNPKSISGLRVREFLGIEGVRKVKAFGKALTLEYSSGMKYEINLSRNPRIVEDSQVRFIAYIIRKLINLNKPLTMRRLREFIRKKLSQEGFLAFARPVPPDLTEVDPLDAIWVLNRVPNLKIIQH